MRRKLVGYSLLSVYAFCFFTVVFHTVAHAQTTTEPITPLAKTKDTPQVLAAQTTAAIDPTSVPEKLANPTPTIYVSALAEPKTLPSITPTQAPTNAKKSAVTPTPLPTDKDLPTPTKAPLTPPAAAPQSTANPGGLDAEKLFSMANDYRAARGLPALQKNDQVCSLAASRAPEVAGEVASGNLHAGLNSRALSYWNTENIISMSTEESAFNWWVNDPIHHAAIVGNFTYSCVSCVGNNCAQEFTNFQPK